VEPFSFSDITLNIVVY